MKRFVVYLLIGVSVVVAGLFGIYYVINTLVIRHLRPVHQVVATGVSATSEWTKLRAEIPMEIKKQTQTVFW